MERFLEFDQEVTLAELNTVLAQRDSGIMILRLSKLTGTVKVRVPDGLSHRDIKRAFLPHKVKKIYEEFPIQKVPVY